MGDDACELPPRSLERSLEVEEARQGVGHVLVVLVAGQQDVLQHLGKRGPDPLTQRRRVLLVPFYLHVQRVVVLCLADNLLFSAVQHR